MTVDVRPKNVGEEVRKLSQRLYLTEQQASRPTGIPGIGTDPSVNTITIDGIVVGADASPPTGLTLETGAFMEDLWIDADWSAPADLTAASYDVELARKVGSTYELVQNFHIGGGTSLRMSALEPNQTYGVRVTAINRIGARSETLPDAGFMDISTGIDATIPGQVTGVQAVGSIRTVLVVWTEVIDRDVARGTGTYEVQSSLTNFGTPLGSIFTTATIVSLTANTNTTYYVRVRAIDNSGNAGAWSSVVGATTGFVVEGDIGTGAVTTTKIANLAVGNAQIAALAVDDAKIADLSAAKITAGTLNADRIGANTLDVNKLTASTLTSKIITIGAGGALKIGNAPTTGVLVNDQGIRLYSGGTVKVALDVAGTATFEGNINASTITSSTLTSATINAGTITGATIRSAASGQRVSIEASAIDAVQFYTGHASETLAGRLAVGLSGSTLVTEMRSPRNGNDFALMTLSSIVGGAGTSCNWALFSDAGTQRAYAILGASSNTDVPGFEIGGVDQFYCLFGGTGTNAAGALKGSGNYGYLWLFGGGSVTTLHVNSGLGAGFHVMENSNSIFQPIQASAFNVSSARSVKRNVRDEGSVLERIGQMKVKRFKRIYGDLMVEKPESGKTLRALAPPDHIRRMIDMDEIGLMADELINVVPEAVNLDVDGQPISINLAILVALLCKAVQELNERIPGRT